MHEQILTPDQTAVLQALKAIPAVGEFYLAGGTALALRIGHRRSVDFDFFRVSSFDKDALHEALRATALPMEPKILDKRDTLYVTLGGVTTSFFRYDYPLIEPPEPTRWGFGVAGLRDIAAMKLEAIGSRGSRKDFVDTYFLLRDHMSIADAAAAWRSKYALSREELFHRLRALTYFADAETLALPTMLVPFDWNEAKRALETWTRDAGREMLEV